MAARRLGTAVAAIVIAGAVAATALAHETLDGLAADDYLARLARLPPESGRDPAQDFAFGAMVAEIIELLSQDRASHAGDHSLLASVVKSELEKAGIPLTLDPLTQRYKSHSRPFERYLDRAPDGPGAAEAWFNVIVGRFRDTVLANPFSTAGQSWDDLAGAADASRDFQVRYPDYSGPDSGEEMAFIVAITDYRAVLGAPDAPARDAYEARARESLAQFAARYPDSLRAAAAGNLLEALAQR